MMSTPYENESSKKIDELHAKASLKPISLLNCGDFSYWGKIGLVITIIVYFLYPITILYYFFSYSDSMNVVVITILLIIMLGNFFLLRHFLDYFLNLYRANLEYEFKNMPSSQKLLKVINGLLKFTKEKGFTQDEISSFLSEELRDQIVLSKTTLNKWFSMAKKTSNKNIKNQ